MADFQVTQEFKDSIIWTLRRAVKMVQDDQYWNAIIYTNRAEKDIISAFDAVLKDGKDT